jgi:flavin reductase (DIM6/NTAB) family NADH-FMN oxidoreductase RutF
MHLTKEQIQQTSRIKRLNIINSITGVKPANLIGSISENGHSNLAIFSSIVHLGSNPALLGFILRPQHEVRRDTYDNIMQTKYYTINHIPSNYVENAHYTSAKFDKEDSEFERCKFSEEYLFDFDAPFVKESRVKIGLKLEEMLPIKLNKCVMVIGSIQHLWVDDVAVEDDGQINLELLDDVGIGGLNSYYKLKRIAQFPYARVNELPDFE